MVGSRSLQAVLVAAVALAGWSARGETAVAYIHMEKVFEAFHKTKTAEASLRKQEEIYKERADETVKELEELKGKFERLRQESDSVALSPEARERKLDDARAVQAQFREKERDLQRYLEDKKREMQKDYMASRNQIVKEILEVVQAHAEANNYELVLDVSGMTQNFLPVVLRYPQQKEITAVIIQEINRGQVGQAQEGGAAAAAAPGAAGQEPGKVE